MEKDQFKIRKFSLPQLAVTITSTFITAVLIIAMAMIKIFAFGDNNDYGFWASLGVISLVVILLMVCLYLYLMSSNPQIIRQYNYYFAYMAIVSFVSVIGIFLSLITPLLIPVAYASLLIFPLSRKNTSAFVLNAFCATMILTACMFEYLITGGNPHTVISVGSHEYLWELFTMCVFGIIFGGILPYVIRYKTKRTRYIIACFLFNIVSLALLMLLLFVNTHLSAAVNDFWFVIVAVFIPLLSSLILVPLIESVFNLVTDNRLVELTDIKQPLIARLAEEAPGTFNHSLAVANFAEICANAIGEDPYLARAAAYYHDVGKLENPEYFSENQSSGNPLDELLPEVAAQIIKKHTEQGYRLCEKHRIPAEISRVTVEHHGYMPIKVFYERAKQLTDSEVNIEDYSYRSGKPTSKIAAIIMICDSGEAAIRAMDKPDGERVDALLKRLIHERIDTGQFDECDISLKELETVRRAIIAAYGGLYHKRVKYPDGGKA